MLRARHLVVLCFLAAAAAAAAAAEATIKVVPPVLTQNGQNITVTWSDIPIVGDPSDPYNQMLSDMIVLVQSDAPFGSRWPLKYIWVSQTARSTYQTGSGSATFWVDNHRQDLRFLYLRYPSIFDAVGAEYAWGKQEILANATLKIDPALAAAPHQLRLSLLGFNPHR